MLSIDEAIAQEREMSEPCSTLCTNGCDCTECRKGHKQLAEWLEELKKRRSEDYGYLADIHQSIGYRKAIDDFIHACDKECGYYKGENKNLTRECMLMIAEMLKAGDNNGT